MPSRSVCLAAIFAALAVAASPASAATTFVVSSTGDQPDATPGDHACTTSSEGCTLRAAIQEANSDATAVPYRIRFAASVRGQTIERRKPARLDHGPADEHRRLLRRHRAGHHRDAALRRPALDGGHAAPG